MDSMKDALLRLVKAGIRIRKLEQTYLKVGLNGDPLFETYGDICEAIYALVGEHTDEFKDSVTYIVMTAPILSNERRAEMLYSEWKKNHTDMPRPNVCTTEELFKMFNKNGGYMHETPEGDWS